MAMNRKQLSKRLKALDQSIGALMAAFWNEIASETDFATEDAGSADVDWINGEIDTLLRKHGIIVPDDASPVDG